MKSLESDPSFPAAARADLHIHSKYSNRPSEWFLRRIGAPESFTEPVEIYRRCRDAGMDFITITDHNSIQGALEIIHLPGTFLSSELTTYFPENGAKVHCLVGGITPEQFGDLQKARENIFDLQAYLQVNGILYSIAHPLYRVNDRLTVCQFEKLALMFNCFEVINGSRHHRAGDIVRAILNNLNREAIERLANRHGISPVGATPWRKILTGGSDDHSGLFSATAYTETPPASAVDDFVKHLQAGNHWPKGRDGSSLQLANSLNRIAYTFVHQRLGKNHQGTALIMTMLRDLAGYREEVRPVNPLRAAFRRLTGPILYRHRMRQMSETERLLVEEFRALADDKGGSFTCSASTPEERFASFSRLAHQLGLIFLKRALEKLKEGSLLESVQAIGALSPVLVGLAPYLTAFSVQHKDSAFLREICERHPDGCPSLAGQGGKAWVTDTLRDINGVSRTIWKIAGEAQLAGYPLTVLTSMKGLVETPFPLLNFPPLETFSVPEYPSLTISVPPLLDIVRYIEERDFDEVIISTPGPMGLAALMAARLLGIPTKGIYHTDFPHYIENWTEDEVMGEAAKRFMNWFYGQMKVVYVPTRTYLEELVRLGLERERIEVLSRGVDSRDFNPGFRNEDYWKKFGLIGDFQFIYVGRISSEKNIAVLLDAFGILVAEGHCAELALVGDGPCLERFKKAYGHLPGVIFTGFLEGKVLSTAFASAHALVFPSTSDTFGNVVLEAHASGLPAIVSDRGGPREIVQAHGSGIVTNAERPEPFAAAMRRLLTDPELYSRCRDRAATAAAENHWKTILQKICIPGCPKLQTPFPPRQLPVFRPSFRPL